MRLTFSFAFRITLSTQTNIEMTAEVQHPPVKVETGTVINNPQQENRADSPPTIVTVRMVVDGKVRSLRMIGNFLVTKI